MVVWQGTYGHWMIVYNFRKVAQKKKIMEEHQEELQRKPRIVWATPYCLLDTSSGASISAREMLRQLVVNGYEVSVFGATVFDSESGLTKFPDNWKTLIGKEEIILLNDPPLEHRLLVTVSTVRSLMTAYEADRWYALYVGLLDTFKPDLVLFYGGMSLDLLISDAARERKIPCAAYLANGNYSGKRWCRDVDLIITNSQANSDYYARKEGFTSIPVGVFIDPAPVVSLEHTRKNILFINPSLEKGAVIVIQLALLLEKTRPDIKFEVVECRGSWQELVRQVTKHYGEQREALDNVIVKPNTNDMRPVYGRARLLLAPSLWWESAGRVVVEAMLNGIPAIVTDRGGLPETLGIGGIKVQFPEECYEEPYTYVPKLAILEPLVEKIVQFYDDDVFYNDYVARALHEGKRSLSMEESTNRLMNAFRPFIQKAYMMSDRHTTPG